LQDGEDGCAAQGCAEAADMEAGDEGGCHFEDACVDEKQEESEREHDEGQGDELEDESYGGVEKAEDERGEQGSAK